MRLLRAIAREPRPRLLNRGPQIDTKPIPICNAHSFEYNTQFSDLSDVSRQKYRGCEKGTKIGVIVICAFFDKKFVDNSRINIKKIILT